MYSPPPQELIFVLPDRRQHMQCNSIQKWAGYCKKIAVKVKENLEIDIFIAPSHLAFTNFPVILLVYRKNREKGKGQQLRIWNSE